MDSREIAASEERHWRRIALPMPARCAYLEYEEHFTVEESARLLHCVLPQDMSDKWIVLVDDFRLSFHRSWTGFCIYAVTLVSPDPDEDPTHYCTCDAIVNRDPAQYGASSDEFDAARLSWLIRTLVLGQAVELPTDPSQTYEDSLVEAWGFAGNAAFAAPESDPRAATGSDPAPGGAPMPERRTPPDDPPIFLHGL